MKVIYQHDERDCGAACLAMVANHYGLRYSLAKFRELTKTTHNGTNIYGIVDGANRIGLEAETLSGNANELGEAILSGEVKFPFIAHVINDEGMLHFIVIKSFKNEKLVIADPGNGKYKIKLEDFYKIWTGYIVVFEKTNKFVAGNYVSGVFRKYFRLLKGQYYKIIGILLISFIVAGIGIVGAFIFETMIDNFTAQQGTYLEEMVDSAEGVINHSEINGMIRYNKSVNILEKLIDILFHGNYNYNILFILIIGLYIFQTIIQLFRARLIVSLSKVIDLSLIEEYYHHIIDLPVESVMTRKTGEYLSRFGDTDSIRTAVSSVILTLVFDTVMVLGCGGILYLHNRILFIVSLIMIVLYTIVLIVYKRPLEHSNRNVMENNAAIQSFFKESIDGIETLKALCAEKINKVKASEKIRIYIKHAAKNNILTISQDIVVEAIELIGTVIILWLGFSMALHEQITIGSLITFYVLLGYFTNPVKNLISLQPILQQAIVAAERLNDVLEMKKENFGKNQKADKFRSLELKNIDFRYGNNELILKDINLSIKAGEKIAIIGESGSGKTTIAKLLLRFYNSERGVILLNKTENIDDLSLASWRKRIAYVDQNTFLFADTIKANLKLGNEEVSDAEMIRICKIVHIDDFVNMLPLGYNTPLDENGMNLSGGQKQRIALARALMRKPEILILDEATSNLDSMTEDAIQEALFSLDNELTCIFIVHRLSITKRCDKIYVIKNGCIIENGSHAELIDKKRAYYRMLL